MFDPGEGIMIEHVYDLLLDQQRRERYDLTMKHEREREAHYRQHKAYWDSRPKFDPKRDWKPPSRTG